MISGPPKSIFFPEAPRDDEVFSGVKEVEDDCPGLKIMGICLPQA